MKAKKRVQKGQKLRAAVTYAASCLKEAGAPLHGLGPSLHYADAFARYSSALKDLVAHACPLHVADWSWDGYEGNFHFYWEFGAQLAQPASTYEHDTRFVAARCASCFDLDKPLDDELARLHAEAEHYDELRGAMMRWSNERRAKAQAKQAKETP
jgi:hypothetical protein